MRFLKYTAVVNGAFSLVTWPGAMVSLIPSRWSSSPRMLDRVAGGFACAVAPPLRVKNAQCAVLSKGATNSSVLSLPLGRIDVRQSPSLPGTAVDALKSYRMREYRKTGVPSPAESGGTGGLTRTFLP